MAVEGFFFVQCRHTCAKLHGVAAFWNMFLAFLLYATEMYTEALSDLAFGLPNCL